MNEPLQHESIPHQERGVGPRKKDSKIVRFFIRLGTALYAAVFVIIFWLSLYLIASLGTTRIPNFLCYTIAAACFCIPVSLIVAIWMMRSMYRKKEYKKVCCYFLLPFAVTLLMIIYVNYLDRIF